MDRLKDKFRQKLVDANSSSASERKNESTPWYRKQQKKKDGKQNAYPTQSNTYKDLNKKLSLWDRAYDILKATDSRLVEKYEKLLSEELPSDGSESEIINIRTSSPKEKTLDNANNRIYSKDPEKRQQQLDRIISGGLERIEKRNTTYHIAGHKFVVQEQIARAAELLQWGKEWINDAVQASPQASIVWAAVCIALPLLTKPAAAE